MIIKNEIIKNGERKIKRERERARERGCLAIVCNISHAASSWSPIREPSFLVRRPFFYRQEEHLFTLLANIIKDSIPYDCCLRRVPT